jgi:hypothetical protein
MHDQTDDTTPLPGPTEASPWIVEHYGFDDDPVSQPRPPAASPVTPAPRRTPRVRSVAAAAALVLGLVTGAGGFLVARAGAGNDQAATAQLVDVHHDHGGGRDGRR